jgi:putative endonuclease
MTPGGTPPRGPTTRERGRQAEDLAAAWLERQGFTVLARNHATPRGEVDLVCREGETLCFVEVRSRAPGGYGSAAESVTRAKARRVVAAATHWALQHGGLDQPMRFDVVAITTGPGRPELELFRGAFDASGRRGP